MSAGDRTAGRRDAIDGARTMAPILLGVVPFGLVAGVTAVEAGMTPLQAVAMSVLVFAGAAQLAAIELVARSAPVAVVVLTVLVINLRYIMYSASLAPYLRCVRAPARWLSAYVLTDQAYAVSLAEFRETRPTERSRLWYYLGGSFALWSGWQVSTAVGAVAGAAVPDGLSLGFAVPLTFLALLVPALTDRTTLLVAGVSATVGVAAASLPFDLGLVTAALVGVTVGVTLDLGTGRFPVTEDEDADDGADDEDEDDRRPIEPGPAGAGETDRDEADERGESR